MPTLVLLAGPNGAGNTPFINRFLRQRAEAFRFVNPDAVSLSRRWRKDRIRSDDGLGRLRAPAIRIARKGEGLAGQSA